MIALKENEEMIRNFNIMKLAIMQPYFFPYIGYFQLMSAADVFVIYDDVNYIKQGWINRNYILANGKKHLITLELQGASSFRLINQIRVGGNRGKLTKTVYQAYARAPYFKDVFPIIERIINFDDDNLARYIANSLHTIAALLNLPTKLIVSSGIEKDNYLKGQARVLNICKSLKADEYINAIGGQTLYSKTEFEKHSVRLHFIKTKEITYRQFHNEFVHNLSIIDVLMFNPLDEVIKLLNEYEMIE